MEPTAIVTIQARINGKPGHRLLAVHVERGWLHVPPMARDGRGTMRQSDVRDRELLARWVDGDGQAGNQLIRRHYDAIYRFFRSKVDDAAAEDLVQSVFFGLVGAKDRFRGDASFRTFLFAIARNRLYQYLRDKGRLPKIDTWQHSVHDILAPSLSSMVRRHEDRERLMRAMRTIPIDSQIVLELRYFEEMSMGEIAVVLEIPEGTVKSRLDRARKQLAEALLEESLDTTGWSLEDWAQWIRDQLA